MKKDKSRRWLGILAAIGTFTAGCGDDSAGQPAASSSAGSAGTSTTAGGATASGGAAGSVAAGASSGGTSAGSAGTTAVGGTGGSGGSTSSAAGAGGSDSCALPAPPDSGAVTGSDSLTSPIESNNPTRRLALKDKAATHAWDVVFVGDSHTENWKWEGQLWGQYFNVAPFNLGVPVAYQDQDSNWLQDDTDMADFGIISDGTQHLLYRLQNGELDGLGAQGKPRIVALLIGANNVETADGDALVSAIGQVIREIRFRLPETRILLQGIFPKKTPDIVDRILYVNSQLGELADGVAVRYLDFSQEFLTPEGDVDLTLRSGDQVHLNHAGYQLWADTVQPVLAEMLAECP